MKHRALIGLVASSVGLLTLGFACVDADIPTVNNRLRDALEENYANAGAAAVGVAGDGGSASTPMAGAGGAPDEPANNPDDGEDAGVAGSSMAAGGAGGAGGGEGAAGASPAPVGDVCNGFAVLQANCTGSSCHSQPGAPLGDFASSEEAALEFVGREGSVSCAGQGTIIDPENPEDSLLVTKMTEDFSCGSQMPPDGVPMEQEDIDCVAEWIGSL